MINLDDYRVGTLPSLYVIENFISESIETHLLTNIGSRQGWTQVNGRRVQSWGGLLSKQGILIPAPIPHWMEGVLESISRTTGTLYGDGPCNHVLVNSYVEGEGILQHQDGPCYFPAVAILSLGSPALMRFTGKREDSEEGCLGGEVKASVILLPRSLLIFNESAYESCLHGIDAVTEDILDDTVVNKTPKHRDVLRRQGTRVSLTIRRVPRVLQINL